jgi:hypothetical protein
VKLQNQKQLGKSYSIKELFLDDLGRQQLLMYSTLGANKIKILREILRKIYWKVALNNGNVRKTRHCFWWENLNLNIIIID